MAKTKNEGGSTTKLLKEEGEGRTHVESPLMMESLIDKGLIDGTQIEHEVGVLPDAHMIHIGGRMVDRGSEAIPGIVEEIVAIRPQYKTVLGVGGGIRERHTFAQCIDLDLPTGALAQLTGVICKQNATMVFYMFAEHGGVRVAREDFPKLPFYLEAGAIPVIVDMAPYHFWEFLGSKGRIPAHRPDTGAFLLAEVYSCRSCIYLKDVDGVFMEDPKKNPKAEFIPKISVQELIDLDLPDLPIERALLETLALARNRKSIRVINALEPGNIAKALAGEEVGTLIHQ